MTETAPNTTQAETHVDTLIIGGGPGGTPAAMALAMAGRKTMLVEAGQGLGGTCLFEGCIPSKIYRETAFRRAEAARAGEFGLAAPAEPPAVDWQQVQARRHRILTMRAQGALMNARQLPSLEVVFARARLTGPRGALIEAPDQPARAVSFDSAILATGSVPSRLPIPGADLPGVLNSNELIGIGFIPSSIVFIGGGPVGVEMAQIFSMLGAKVTILEAAPRILGPVDPVLAGLLAEKMRGEGIRIETGVSVDRIEGEAAAHSVQFAHHGQSETIAAQIVAIVAGRHPAVDGLGLETTAVRHDRQGVKVGATLETDQPDIFATGDLVGHPMFAHWATAQARAVAAHLLSRPVPYPRPEHNSAVIFSAPEIGMVGLTEEAARAAGQEVAIAEYDYKIDARAQISSEAFGRLRVVYRRSDHRVLGVHAMIEGAADLMGEAAVAVQNGLTLEQIAMAIHPHPTLTEAFGIAALGGLSEA